MMIDKRLINTVADSKKWIGITVLWNWVALIGGIISAVVFSYILQAAYFNELGPLSAVILGIVLIAALALRAFAGKKSVQASYFASTKVKHELRSLIYRKLALMPLNQVNQQSTSNIIQVASEGVEQLEIYFGRYLPQLFYSLLAPLTLFAFLIFFSFKTAVILLICVPLIPMSIIAVNKIAKKLLAKYWSIYVGLGSSFLDNLQGLITLKIYQDDAYKAKAMDEEAEHFRKITMKVLTMQLNSVSVMDIVAYGGAAIGMIVTVKEYLAGNVSLAGAFTIILLASEFFIPLRLLGSFFHIAMNGMSASDKIFKILDMEEPKRGEHEIEGEQMDVTLQHVEFSYEPERKVLRDISLTIPSGKFVSLVGLSGCGKSTIAALLTGKNRTFSGQIQINNVPIQEIKESSLMDKITLVRHNSYLFKGTVEENLKMADPSVSREQMEAALRQVNLYEFLQAQNGLDTMLEEQGSNFSGGQRQRLAIARALLHDTPMYIFDEAASNIDVESEDQIMEVIRELAKTKTILFISHRLANVVASDQIYMLENGQITESGTHGDLMKKAGSYANMYQKQQELCQVREGRA